MTPSIFKGITMAQTPSRDWRKKSHRLQKARDEFRERNRNKAGEIKALKGKTLDLEKSRSQWKKKCGENNQEIKRLTDELQAKEELIEAERKLRQEEAAVHEKELEQLKKKWQQMLQQASLEKKNTTSFVDAIRQFMS